MNESKLTFSFTLTKPLLYSSIEFYINHNPEGNFNALKNRLYWNQTNPVKRI
jgi:hypothetical protein